MSDSQAADPGHVIVDLAFGFVLSGALNCAAKLGLSDHLQEAPQSTADLAAKLNVDELSLYRVLRTLASAGLYNEDDGGRFHLLAPGKAICTGEPNSLRDAVLMITQDIFWKPLGELQDVVASGENGMMRIFGAPFFDYFQKDATAGATFHRGMSSLSDMENAPIAGSYDFTSFDTIVDIGGGHGGFLIEVLKLAPTAHGINYDHAHVLAEARTDELAGRWVCAEGDFFENAPGGDAYLLKRILHDWTDEDCIRILTNIRNAMPDHAKVLVVDCVVPPGNDPHPGKVLDILMMSALPGRERTEADLAALFSKSGLRLNRVIGTPTLLSITEAVAA